MQKFSAKTKFFIVVVIIIVLLAVFFFTVVQNIKNTMCVEEVRARVINIVNNTNDTLQSLNFFYDDYFKLEKNNEGDLIAVVANTGLINQINMIMQTEIQEQLNNLRSFSLAVPAGVFTGSVILSKFGAPINVKIQTVSNSYTEIKSEFLEMGINQTMHRLIITAYINIEMLVPDKVAAKNIFNDVVLAENLIIGKVPQTYMGDNFDTNYLDLLP